MKKYISTPKIVMELASGQKIQGVKGGCGERYKSKHGWDIYRIRKGNNEPYGRIATTISEDYIGDFLTKDTIGFPDGKSEVEIVKSEDVTFQFRVSLNEALLKLQEAQDIAKELDNAGELNIDIDDLEDLITEVENLTNKADGTDEAE